MYVLYHCLKRLYDECDDKKPAYEKWLNKITLYEDEDQGILNIKTKFIVGDLLECEKDKKLAPLFDYTIFKSIELAKEKGYKIEQMTLTIMFDGIQYSEVNFSKIDVLTCSKFDIFAKFGHIYEGLDYLQDLLFDLVCIPFEIIIEVKDPKKNPNIDPEKLLQMMSEENICPCCAKDKIHQVDDVEYKENIENYL